MYKYMERQYAEMLLEKGALRIGTLYDYRDIEQHDVEVGDNREGTVTGQSHVLSWSSNNPVLTDEHPRNFVRGNSVVIEAGQTMTVRDGGNVTISPQGVSMQNVGLSSPLQVQNLLVFSMSEIFDESAMQQMGYDCCVEITDPKRFIDAVSRQVDGELIAFNPVQYQPREMHYQHAKASNPALIKEPRYRYQREVRAIWKAMGGPVAPQIIEAPGIAEHCRIHHVDD